MTIPNVPHVIPGYIPFVGRGSEVDAHRNLPPLAVHKRTAPFSVGRYCPSISHNPPAPNTSSGFFVGDAVGVDVEVFLLPEGCSWVLIPTGDTDQNKNPETFVQVTFTLFEVATALTFVQGEPALSCAAGILKLGIAKFCGYFLRKTSSV